MRKRLPADLWVESAEDPSQAVMASRVRYGQRLRVSNVRDGRYQLGTDLTRTEAAALANGILDLLRLMPDEPVREGG